MKPIRCKCIFYTKRGSVSLITTQESIRKARLVATMMIDGGFAHSYKLIKLH